MAKYALSIAEGIMDFLNIKNYSLKLKKKKLVVLIERTISLLNKLLEKITEKERK